MNNRVNSIFLAAMASTLLLSAGWSVAGAAEWDEVQNLKRGYLESAAKHAMEQQTQRQNEAVALPLHKAQLVGRMTECPEREADQPRQADQPLRILMNAEPQVFRREVMQCLRIELDEPMDMIAGHSGLTLTVELPRGNATSGEVRLGVRLIAPNGKNKVEMLPMVPLRRTLRDHPLGDEQRTVQEIYLDWAFLNYADVEQAVGVLKAVKTIELTFASRLRTPERGSSREAAKADFRLSNLRLVDYLRGSYDPSRQWLAYDEKAGRFVASEKKDLTLQHRCQEVTGLVATFGGEAGHKSAIESLDFAVRTQCWDGSFLDGRRGANTVVSGEYTFGFTLYGLLTGYQALERARVPQLDEKMTVGPETMTRREFYRQMFYRGAMARAATGSFADYRDDIIGGNTLITGANRVLGYTIAMRMIAEMLGKDDPRAAEIMKAYQPLMQEIVDAQGKFSGGWPVLGEGDRYSGRGIHYDAGYTRTHMDWLVVGVRQTGDPLLVKMLEQYQQVFIDAMDAKGTGILPLLSERHPGTTPTQLILPDATAQVGLAHGLPVIAQWGYNVGMPVWKNWEAKAGNHFTFASHIRGYQLGAHVSILLDDMEAEPKPRDLGYLFPRQMPVWSSRMTRKDGTVRHTSTVTFHPDGKAVSDFGIEVGEFPRTVGVPVMVRSAEGKVVAEAVSLTGWPGLMPDGAEVSFGGDLSGKGKVGQPQTFKLAGPTRVIVSGPQVTLPKEMGGGEAEVRAELKLTPEKPGQTVELTVLNKAAGDVVQVAAPQEKDGQ